MRPDERAIVDAFHRLHGDTPEGECRAHHRNHRMGVPCLETPVDLWIDPEIPSR